MDWIEVTARTVDEAKELALDRLGVVEDELEWQVLDEARSGLFGLGRSDARIRARVRPLSREKPADRRRRGPRARDRRGNGGEPAVPRYEAGNGSSSGRGEAGPRTEPATTTAGAPRRRRRRGGSGSSGGARGAVNRERVHRDEDMEGDVEAETVPVAAQAEQATEFADGLLHAMGFNARVDTDVEDGEVFLRIEGEGLGVLVGPRGVTLNAVEELVRAVVQHNAGGHSARIHVDVGGYRERRRAALVAFVEQVAQEVRESGVARALEPMSPPDRKVVHDTAAALEGVATASEGEEPRRRVVIRPA